MKKNNGKLSKRLRVTLLVIGAEVILFGGCLVMIYARGTGAEENHASSQGGVAANQIQTEQQSSLQAGTNKGNITQAGNAQSESESEVEATEVIAENTMIEKTNSEYLGVEAVLQLPELPTGCEVTALTMALNFEGYGITKEEIADDYLIKGRAGMHTPAEAFLGDPRDDESFGCYAPVIATTANRYLREQESEKIAYDVSGMELEDLYDYVRQGIPVIIWNSMYQGTDIEYLDLWEIDGERVSWPANEHCMVLSGFDLVNNTVTVCDPLSGEEVYDRDIFEEHYEQMKQQAVVIK